MQLLPERLDLVVATAARVVVIEDAAPVLLRAETTRPPAEEKQAIRAVGNGRVGHPLDLFGFRVVVEVAALPARPGLLLRDHKVARPRAGVIQHKRLSKRTVFRIGNEERVHVEAQKIQVLGEVAAIVDVAERPVVGDEPRRIRRPQDFHLLALEAGDVPRDEAGVVQQMRGIGVGRFGVLGRLDFVEAAEGERPERVAPRNVERADVVLILLAQELAEGDLAVLAVALAEVAVQLVVGLPANHVWVVREVFGHRLGDRAAVQAKDGAARAGVLPRPVLHPCAIRIDAQRVWMRAREPTGRRRRRRAEDRRNALLAEPGNRLVEQRKIEFTLARLHQVPGELCHADDVEPGFDHPFRVLLAGGGVPVFGVVRRAIVKRLQIRWVFMRKFSSHRFLHQQ